MKSNKSQMKNKQEKDCMCISARHTSIVVVIKKYHGNKTNAFHFLGIAYKKPKCLNLYEKLGRSSLYDWFTYRREIKAKYAHLVESGTWVQIRNWKLPILEIYLVSWLNHVAKDERGKSTPNNIYYPTHIRGMIKSLTPNVICDTKFNGFNGRGPTNLWNITWIGH